MEDGLWDERKPRANAPFSEGLAAAGTAMAQGPALQLCFERDRRALSDSSPGLFLPRAERAHRIASVRESYTLEFTLVRGASAAVLNACHVMVSTGVALVAHESQTGAQLV